MMSTKVGGIRISLSSNRPDPRTGFIDDRIRCTRKGRRLRVVEISTNEPGEKDQNHWVGDGYVGHRQIVWNWQDDTGSHWGIIGGSRHEEGGPWQFAILEDRVVFLGDADVLADKPAPQWADMVY